MSFWSADQESVVEDQSEFVSGFPKNSSIKIDSTSKLQVIQALDNGQCKSDIAREYGVHPQTISSIYKQKESIIKKYNHKYNLLKKICSINLEQKLLDWFEEQTKIGNDITDDHLRIKAQDLLEGLSEEFTCIDDWLCSFRTRHNISKYTVDNVCNVKAKEDWKNFHNSLETKYVYIGGVCALSHSLDVNGFLSGQDADSYVSLMFTVNILGSDKRELAVVGKDLMDTESHVRSLPVNYYYCANSQINYSVVLSYLTKWENELASKGNHVFLVLDIPESLIENLCFDNIRIIGTRNLRYVKSILEKIVDCYKYQYRRLQISRTLTYGKDNTSFMEYIHMIGMAWYNTPEKYIRSLCFPPGDGSLYFNVKEDSDTDHSISRWCKIYNVPMNLENCSETLDKYIFCDSKLPCFYCGHLDESMPATEVLTQKVCHSTSGMEAYQAMKRIVSYLQAESAGTSIMKYAKYLENHLEYGALLQMHQIIASSNNPI
ncbi:tigger transposable element-derived protein 6-like [Helicoverpa zea]|uniref:tigger transposable element-derived protein 6-like n=1 Tax=Helicoverpa zea TaxID=7113 RepID=UPI001F57FB10|nr:tigger transposable element-derived protein 6-like [Helicoverpa zea]